MYSAHLSISASFQKNIVVFVHYPRCLDSLSTIRYSGSVHAFALLDVVSSIS